MQILPGPGDLVRVRGTRWRVVELRRYDECHLVSLAGAGAQNVGERCRIMAPFDRIEPIVRPSKLRLVTPRQWRAGCRAVIADDTPPGGLAGARHARIDILPHQLEPALAVVNGLGSRLLLADDVGLGKTIQAGLVLAELRARSAAERTIILTPAGLREQWHGELSERFGIAAAVVGAREIRHRLAFLPVGVNPWSAIEVAIASFDYVKRPEVLPAVASCHWDVLIVDEAHNVAGHSDRHHAVTTLAAKCRYVLLLTATPHSGDREAFASLCRVGERDDPLLVFRRSRRDVHVGIERRVHCLHVRPSAAERRMHALVSAFSRTVRHELRERGAGSDGAWLALTVLNKRALSSARSLERTVERRLAALATTEEDAPAQLALPMPDPEGETDDADRPPEFGGPALADRSHERALLQAIAWAARAAARRETKISALVRLLRRTGERAVVFTEYRDTLNHLQGALRDVSILHGGLGREERASALADFVGGRARILLATDAAGEGLNLHGSCRLVINLELPWNPMRLEQRIGRVDRIGQRRTVHAVHLIARATAETRILDRLQARISRARTDIGAADPFGVVRDAHHTLSLSFLEESTGAREERATAIAVVGECDESAPNETAAVQTSSGDLFVIPALGAVAAAEADRVRDRRRLTAVGDTDMRRLVEASGPWLTHIRSRQTRRALGARLLAIARVDCEDGCGRVAQAALLPILIELQPGSRPTDRTTLQRIVEHAMAGTAVEATAQWFEGAASATRVFVERRLVRERAIGAVVEAPVEPFQSGLFDRRAEDRHRMAIDRTLDAAAESARRIAALARAADIRLRSPRLLLLLVP